MTETVIKYHQGSRTQAKLLASKMPGAVMELVPGTSPRLTLVLGSDYGTTQSAESTQSAAPTPSPSHLVADRQPEHLRQLTPPPAGQTCSSTEMTCFSAASRSAACSPKKIRSARLPTQSAGSSSAGSRGSR